MDRLRVRVDRESEVMMGNIIDESKIVLTFVNRFASEPRTHLRWDWMKRKYDLLYFFTFFRIGHPKIILEVLRVNLVLFLFCPAILQK